MTLAHAHNRDTVPLRGPLRASGGLRTSLVWISKPVVSRLRRKPYRCRYFTVEFSLFSLAVTCHHFCSIVAVQRLCQLSELTCTCPNRTFPRDKENWPYHKNVTSLYCVNHVTCRARCWKCWVHRIILRNFGGRLMNSFIVHVRPLSVENEALLKWNFTCL